MKITFLSLFICLFNFSAFSQAPAQSIAVNGYGEEKIDADMIRMSISLSDIYLTDGSTINTITDQYNGLVRRLGVDMKRNILVSSQSYEPVPGDDYSTKYEVRNYELTFNNLDSYNKFNTEIYLIPGASAYMLDYSYSKLDELKDKAYKKAMDDAKLRADKLLMLTGLKTSGVYSIEDLSSVYSYPMTGSNYYYDGEVNPDMKVTFAAQLHIVYLFTK